MADLSEFLPLRFEPHNGFGSDDPDGDPWPFGYLSTSHPVPIFELSVPVQHDPETLRELVALIVRAVNAHEDLCAALRALAEAALSKASQGSDTP